MKELKIIKHLKETVTNFTTVKNVLPNFIKFGQIKSSKQYKILKFTNTHWFMFVSLQKWPCDVFFWQSLGHKQRSFTC